MEPLQFKEIQELLNACRLTQIDDKPIKSEKGCWELYRGNYRAHVVEVPFEVLYILADATKESIKSAVRQQAFKPKETFVVYAPSTKIKATLNAEFEKTARGFWSTTEYLASFMSHELEAYRKALQALTPQHYIDPFVQPPSGTSHRNPNPLQLFLTDPETITEQEGTGSVAVVLAEAGHGKTYMCHWLVAKLATNNYGVLPIFVSSSQWQRLRPEDLSSLGTTIVSSFRELGTPIPWIEGQEDLFLKVALRAGLFRIVFDGFDEYVLKMPGNVEVTETLSAISSLASETGTRVILTSRTSFWESEFPTETNANYPKQNTNVSVFRLSPFSADLARNYFKLRFPNENHRVERADGMFRELAKDGLSFAGRGFVLVLIADLVRSDQDLGKAEKPLIRLMRAHCERERKRQELQLTSQQQLDALKDFVFEVYQGADPNSDLLLCAIQLAAPELTEEEANICLEKMAPHALIEGRKDLWSVRQAQVEIALLAMKLMDIAGDEDKGLRILEGFSGKGLDPNSESDLASMLTALCLWDRKDAGGPDAIRQLISSFFRASSIPIDTLRKSSLRRLATLITLRTVDEQGQQTHSERAKALRDLFPSQEYRGIVFFGGLSRFDWSGQVFEGCVFDNVRWSNCRFDENTTFRDCHLYGGSTQYCSGLVDANWANRFADDSGRQFLDNLAVASGKKSYTEEHLKRDMSFVVEKFIGKGGVGFRSITNSDLGKGKISVSPHKDVIIDLVRKHLLEEHHISGVDGTGLKVTDGSKDAVRVLIANNAWTGELANLLEDAKKRTGIG